MRVGKQHYITANQNTAYYTSILYCSKLQIPANMAGKAMEVGPITWARAFSLDQPQPLWKIISRWKISLTHSLSVTLPVKIVRGTVLEPILKISKSADA